jgi:hypothetical protein
MYCPESYRLSYVASELPSQYTSVTRLYEYAMQKAAYRFFWSAFAGEPLTMGQLRETFGQMFIGQRSKVRTIAMSTNPKADPATLYEQRGVESINRFYRRWVDDIGTPIIINEDYELRVGDVLLKGTLPVLREYQNDIELLDFRSDYTYFKRSTEWMIMSHDIALIAAGLAFKHIFDTDVKAFRVYMLGSGSTHIIQKKLTALERFHTTVTSVGRAIQNGIYFPSYNTNCLNCAYYQRCVVT